jgi:hypothetical protein
VTEPLFCGRIVTIALLNLFGVVAVPLFKQNEPKQNDETTAKKVIS